MTTTWKDPHFSESGSARYAGLLSQYLWGAPVGRVLFVSSLLGTNATGYGYSPETPLASAAYAFSADLVTADNNDFVCLLPGHTETVTGAAGVLMDVAGVTLMGWPVGKGRQRPRINFTTAAGASLDITAARCRLANLSLQNGIDSQTAMVNVSAADATLEDLEFDHGDASTQAVLCVLTTSSASRLRVANCHFHGLSTAGTTAAISLVGGDSIIIENNRFHGAYDATGGVIKNATTDSTGLQIVGNDIQNVTAVNTKSIVLTASSTGLIARNTLQILSGSSPITGAAMAQLGNTYSNTIASDSGLSTITDALYGTNGIASYPAAAAPANAVSIAEVLRAVYNATASDGSASSNAVNPVLGRRVSRATADIITGGTTVCFNITGGRVLLTGFVAEVTTVIGAGATNMRFQSNPTTGTTTNLCADLDIDADEQGALYTLSGTVSDALQRSESGGVGMGLLGNPIILPIGAIESVSGTDRTGSIKIDIWYVPLDDGAAVASA